MRINIEDSLLTKLWFQRLAAHFGSVKAAIGELWQLWRVGGDFWWDGERPIPFEIFEREFDPVFVESGAVVRNAEGYYCRGASDCWSWMQDKRAAGRLGGRKSGESRKQTKQDATLLEATNSPAPAPAPAPVQRQKKKEPPSAPQRGDGLSPRKLIDLWNANRGTLPEVQEFTPERQRHARARLDKHPNADQWLALIRYLAASDFHTGGNDRGWRASFDFLVRPQTIVKFIEGRLAGQQKSDFDLVWERHAQEAADAEQSRT